MPVRDRGTTSPSLSADIFVCQFKPEMFQSIWTGQKATHQPTISTCYLTFNSTIIYLEIGG